MNKIVIKERHSYLIDDSYLSTIEPGTLLFDPTNNKLFKVSEPGVLIEFNIETMPASTLEELTEALAAGGIITITENIDAPTGINIISDSTINLNNNTISISEDTDGNGVFKVTNGTLTLQGEGIINGVGKNDLNMALWATENGKIIINDGYFTNVGATAEVDPTHFDLIYASGNGQVEINGGEFECETPAWTLNVKDKDRATANIIVKGGKFHGFNPSNCKSEGENTNFVAPGYKVIEETEGIFIVMPE